jgi:putative peptidoglycan lipid II flippase
MLSNVRVVTLISILAQVAAFARTAIMADIFGATNVVDAYNLALVVPVMIAGVVGGWLQVGFVGKYTERLAHSPDDAKRFRTAVWQVAVMIGVALGVLMMLSRPWVAGMLVPANSSATLRLTQSAIVVVAWSVPLTIASDFMALMLNCHGRFASAAAAPVFNSVVSAVALWLWPTRDLDALVMSLVVGGAVQIGVLVVALRNARIGFSWERPRLTDDLKTVLKVALPVMPAVLLSNGTAVAIQMTCARLGEGAVALYGYASRLHGAVSQILIIGISTVLLPHFATLLAGDKRNEIVRLLWRGGRVALMTSTFVVAGVWILGKPVVFALLGRGHFDHALVDRVADAWLLLTFSLFPFAFGMFFARLYQAKRQPRLLSMSSLVSLIATSGCCLIGYRLSGLSTVLLAPLVAQICVLAYFLFCFRRDFGQVGLFPRRIESLVRCAMWTVPSVATDLVIQHVLPSPNLFAAVLLRGALFTGLFVMTAKLGGGIQWILNTDSTCPNRT